MGTLAPSWSSLFLVPEAAATDEDDTALMNPRGEWALVDAASEAGAAHTLWANGSGTLCWHVDSGGGATAVGTVDGMRGGKLKTTGVSVVGAVGDVLRAEIVLLAWSDSGASVWRRPQGDTKNEVRKLERLDTTTDSQPAAWVKDMGATEGAVWCDVQDLQRPDGTWQRALLAISDNRVFLRVEGAVQAAAQRGFFSWLAWSSAARAHSATFELLGCAQDARAAVRWLDGAHVCVFSGSAESVVVYRLPAEVDSPQTQTHALAPDTATRDAVFGSLANLKVLLDAAPLTAPGRCRLFYGSAPPVRHGRDRARPEAGVAVDSDYACDAWAIVDVSLEAAGAAVVREATLQFRALGAPTGEPSASHVAGGALAVGADGHASDSLDFTVVAYTGTFAHASEAALELDGRRVTRSMAAKALEARQKLPAGRVWTSYFYSGATQTGARGNKRAAEEDANDDGGAAGDRMQEDGEMLARGSKSVRVLEEFPGTEHVRSNVRHLARELSGLEYPRFGWTIRGVVLPGAKRSVAPTRLHAVHGDAFMPRTPLEVVLSCGYTDGSLLNPLEAGHPVRLARSWLTEDYIEVGALNSVRRMFAPSLTRSGGAACVVGTAPTGKELFAFGNGKFAYTCLDNTLFVLRVSGSSVSDPRSLQENDRDLEFPEAGAVCCGVALLTPHGSADRREPATCEVPDAPSSAPLFDSPDDWLVWVFVTARGTLAYRRLCCIDGVLRFAEEWKEARGTQDYLSVGKPPHVGATPRGLGLLTDTHYLFVPFASGSVGSAANQAGFRAAQLRAPSASLGVGAHSLCVEFGDDGPLAVHNGSLGKSHAVARQTPIARVLAASANGVRVVAVCVDTDSRLVLVSYGLYGDQYVEEDCHVVPFDLVKAAGDKLPKTLACICGVWTSLWVTDTGILTFETGNPASCIWTRWGGSRAGTAPAQFDSFVPHPRLVDPWWSWERVSGGDFFCTLGVRTSTELEWLAEAGGLPVGFCGVLREDPEACAGILLLPNDEGDIILDAEYGVLARVAEPETGAPIEEGIRAIAGAFSSALLFVPSTAIVAGTVCVLLGMQVVAEKFSSDQTQQLRFIRRTVPSVTQSILLTLLSQQVITTAVGVPLEGLDDPAEAAEAMLRTDALKYAFAWLSSWLNGTSFSAAAASLGNFATANAFARLFSSAVLVNRTWHLAEIACNYVLTPPWLASTYKRLGISPASLAVAQACSLTGRTLQTAFGAAEWLRRPTASLAQTYTGLLSPNVTSYPRPWYTDAADLPVVGMPVRYLSGTHFSRFEITTFTHWSRDSPRLFRDQASASGRLTPSSGGWEASSRWESFPGNAARGGPEVMLRAMDPGPDGGQPDGENAVAVSRPVAFASGTVPLTTADVDLLDLLNVNNDAPWTGEGVRAVIVGPYVFVAGARRTDDGDFYSVGVLRAGAVAINGTVECGWYYRRGTAVVAQWLLTDCPFVPEVFALTAFKAASPHDVFVAFSRWSTEDIPAAAASTADKPPGEWGVVALFLVSVLAPNNATLTSLRPSATLIGTVGFQYLAAPGTPCAAVLTGSANCAPMETGVCLSTWGVDSLVSLRKKRGQDNDPKRTLVQVFPDEPYRSTAQPPLLSLSAVWEPAYTLSDAPDAYGLALRLQRLRGTDDVVTSRPCVERSPSKGRSPVYNNSYFWPVVSGGTGVAGHLVYYTVQKMLGAGLIGTALSMPVVYGAYETVRQIWKAWKKSRDANRRAAKRQRTQEQKDADRFEWSATVLGVSQKACAERRQIVLQRNIGSDGRRAYVFREFDAISERFVQDFDPDDALYDALVELDDAPTLNRQLRYVIAHRHWAVCLVVYDVQSFRASIFNIYLDARARSDMSPARLLVRGFVPADNCAVPLSLDVGDQYSTLTYWPRTGTDNAAPTRAVLALLPWTYPDFARFTDNPVRFVQLAAAAGGVILGTHANDVSDEVRAVVRIPAEDGAVRLVLRVWSTRAIEDADTFEPAAAGEPFIVRESLANTVASAAPRFTINGLQCNRADPPTAVVPVDRSVRTPDVAQASPMQVARIVQRNAANDEKQAAKNEKEAEKEVADLKKACAALAKKVGATAEKLAESFRKLSHAMNFVDQALQFASAGKPNNHWAVTARTTIANLRASLTARLEECNAFKERAIAANAAAQAAGAAEELNTLRQELQTVLEASDAAARGFKDTGARFDDLKAEKNLEKALEAHLQKLKAECDTYAKRVQDVCDRVQKAATEFSLSSQLDKQHLQPALKESKTKREAGNIVAEIDNIQRVLTEAGNRCTALLRASNELKGRAERAKVWTSVDEVRSELAALAQTADTEDAVCSKCANNYSLVKKKNLLANAAAKEAREKQAEEDKKEEEKQKILDTMNKTFVNVVKKLDEMKAELKTLNADLRKTGSDLAKSRQQPSTENEAQTLQAQLTAYVEQMRAHADEYGVQKGGLYQNVVGPSTNAKTLEEVQRLESVLKASMKNLEAANTAYDKAKSGCVSIKKLAADLAAKAAAVAASDKKDSAAKEEILKICKSVHKNFQDYAKLHNKMQAAIEDYKRTLNDLVSHHLLGEKSKELLKKLEAVEYTLGEFLKDVETEDDFAVSVTNKRYELEQAKREADLERSKTSLRNVEIAVANAKSQEVNLKEYQRVFNSLKRTVNLLQQIDRLKQNKATAKDVRTLAHDYEIEATNRLNNIAHGIPPERTSELTRASRNAMATFITSSKAKAAWNSSVQALEDAQTELQKKLNDLEVSVAPPDEAVGLGAAQGLAPAAGTADGPDSGDERDIGDRAGAGSVAMGARHLPPAPPAPTASAKSVNDEDDFLDAVM